ncbi:BCD family MFS transporter [Sandaracinobacteroides saxicola]|uniref:BCD family MFS transporter n=1 Tax=Sandaracinobacteroides saxicola TaxID=2759707 RepID=A0A7G5IKU4_9SPHN|nr:BCD family MFS transporter [Sandaracinobacteroides saxicola]QMW23986.1 BCD family MFS transporter [Sandaracinobacteroides saxicola]
MSGDGMLGWPGIVRLGLVQSALGGIVMLATSILNRIMVVEYALFAAVPAGLIAWHFVVQLSRPRWGYGSDVGGRRTTWIIGGMGVLCMGGLLAANATLMMREMPLWAAVMAFVGYTMIGAGVAAAGTSLLALLATQTAPARRPAAAALTWIMMVAGIVVTAAVSGSFLDPFTPQRLANVAGTVPLAAFLLTLLAVWGVEKPRAVPAADKAPPPPFREAAAEVWQDAQARRFAIFVFLSMLAYSTQDMILEPFAGLVFNFTPGASTKLSSVQHMGVLLGMILVGVGGRAFTRRGGAGLKRWVMLGCLGSALALTGLGLGALAGPGWPLKANVFLLGFGNGVFAVSAIAAMMDLAGMGTPGREGMRMGIWGAAQAVAFGAGGLLGAVGVDMGRQLLGSTPEAFLLVFSAEALMFLGAAMLARRIDMAGNAEARKEELAYG